MKRLLLACTLLALAAFPAFASAQVVEPTDPPTVDSVLGRLSGTYAVDFFAKGEDGKRKTTTTQALLYRTQTLTNFLPSLLKGRFKTNIDIDGVLGASGSGASLGFAALVQAPIRGTVANELRFNGTFSIGPAALYNTDGKGFHLGAIVGLTFKG